MNNILRFNIKTKLESLKIEGKNNTRGGTRTHNLFLRREAPYPLGHASNFKLYSSHTAKVM